MATRRKTTVSKESPDGGKVLPNMLAWRKTSCCETPAGLQPPKIEKLVIQLASHGTTLGIIFETIHTCGLKNYSADITVVDTQGGTWTQTLEDSFDCDGMTTGMFRARWLWAVAKISGGKSAVNANYLGPLPGQIVSASVTVTVESCCGKKCDKTAST